MGQKVNDLRSALELLKSMPGQYAETEVEVDPRAELSGVYRYIGAGGTVMRPTKEGPAMGFNRIKGHPGAKVAIGLLSSRTRVAALFGCRTEELGKKLWECHTPLIRLCQRKRQPVRKWCIWQKNRDSIWPGWCPRPPIRRMTPGHISPWECVMPAIPTQGPVM